MTVQMAVCAAFFFIGIGCVIRANLLLGEIVADVNRLLPEELAISLSGFARRRFFDILAKYRRLYPNGKLAHQMSIWVGVGFACLFGAACYWFFSGAGSVGYVPKHR
jgi:hypothetical protein